MNTCWLFDGEEIRMHLSYISALMLFLLLSQLGAQELRRIDPERFPEVRIETQSSARVPPAQPVLVIAEPLAACQGSGQRALCLQALSAQSSTRLSALLREIEAHWMANESLTGFQRQAWVRSLKEADRRFRFMRDEECGLLAMAEPHGESELYSARLVCEILRNVERIRSISERYSVVLSEM